MCEGCYGYDEVDSLPGAEGQTLSELISERVGQGIEFLNDDLGPGWAESINTDDLSLSNTLSCVIGQLYPSSPEGFDGWFQFHQLHRKTVEWMTDHGFDDLESGNYEYLTREWKIRIHDLIHP